MSKKKWKLGAFNAPAVHEMPKGAKGKNATTAATIVSDQTDDREAQKWWIAVSIATNLFGDHGSLDPNKDISGQTDSDEGAAAIAMYTNSSANGTCSLLGFRWDWVTTEEIKACKRVHQFVALVIANII